MLRVGSRVVIYHLRYYVSNPEKYKGNAIFLVHEDRDKEDCNFVGDFIP